MSDSWLTLQAARCPHAPALQFNGTKWTYSELQRETIATSCALRKLGVSSGDRVALVLANQPSYVFLLHALARIGAIAVPINTRLADQELLPLLQLIDPKLIVVDAKNQAQFVSSLSHFSWIDPVKLQSTYTELPDKDSFDVTGNQGILFTSGTSGKPKGVQLSWRNHYVSALGGAARLGAAASDRWLLCVPLFHVAGIAMLMRVTLAGSSIELMDGFSPEAVDAALQKEEISCISLVPTMLKRLLEIGTKPPFGLRLALVGGGPISQTLWDEAIQAGWPLAITYGLTEAASQVATARPGSQKVDPLEGIELGCLVAGEIRSQGSGEICVAGSSITRGYWKAKELFDRRKTGRWFCTGDIGEIAHDGSLRILDRRDDLIVSGGENIVPYEVESVIETYPHVEEVAVVGIPDEEWGQRCVAIVVPEEASSFDSRELEQHCREQLAGYKLPRRYYLWDALPHSANGKVKRYLIRQQLLNGDGV